MVFRINTNGAMNVKARKMYEKLMYAAREYRRERGI